jgi:hypothetical protein
MDTFFVVIISGMAAGYVVEFLVTILEKLISGRVLRTILTAPLSILAVWLFGLSGWLMVAAGLAAAFFALVILGLINKPQVVTAPLTRRL